MIVKSGVSHWRPGGHAKALQDITLGGLLREQAQLFGDRPAIIFDEPAIAVRWTYAELDREVDIVARALMAIGISAGDHVALMSPNRPEWVLLEYALARIGAILVTVNPAFKAQELRYLLTQGRISTLVCIDTYRGFPVANMLGVLMPDLASCNAGQRQQQQLFPHLRNIISLGDTPIAGALPFAQLLTRANEVDAATLAKTEATVAPKDIAQIQYTSGTTGNPKGAMLTHYGTVNNAILAGDRAGLSVII